MANQKPKKAGKKSDKPETKKDLKETKDVKEVNDTKVAKETTDTKTTIVAPACEKPMKGFFARKYGEGENILTIFKTPKIWGALIGEVLGTMLLVMLLLTLGVQPLYLWMGIIAIYAVIFTVSGANLNPLITAGMMATRRMSAIRGILYMLAQLLGAWIGLLVINAFRLGSGTMAELPMMTEVTGETFWATALVELMGAIVIAFCFVRALKFSRKNPIAMGLTMASAITLAVIFGIVVAQSFFGLQTSFIFNPVAALMYQILPTAAENFGELASLAGLAAAAYIVFPVIGGIIGSYLADIMTRLAGDGYSCECDQPCCGKVCSKAEQK